ncbi:hypothetical protein AGMMS49965_08480 [Bacteroidia bacterium]|nr:hypothetical protein AGMMS49965_08480 [Bacteroidia bacterium]
MSKVTSEKFMELFESGSDEIDAYINKDFVTIIHPNGQRDIVVKTVLQDDVAKSVEECAKNDGISPAVFISRFLAKNLPKTAVAVAGYR